MSSVPKPSDIFDKKNIGKKIVAYNKYEKFDKKSHLFTQDENLYRSFTHFNKEERDEIEAAILEWLAEKLGYDYFEELAEKERIFCEHQDHQFTVLIEEIQTDEYNYIKVNFLEKFIKEYDDNREECEVDLELILGYSNLRNWLWVNVQIVSNFDNERTVMAETPRFISRCNDKLFIKDGSFFESSGAKEIETDSQYNKFLTYLLSESRVLPVVVASEGDDESALEGFRANFYGWEKTLSGVVAFYVIKSEYVEKLNSVLGESYSVREYSVRTFMPDLDIHDSDDAIRHKFITAKNIANNSILWSRLILGRSARSGVNSRPVPKAIRAAKSLFAKKHNRQLLEALPLNKQDFIGLTAQNGLIDDSIRYTIREISSEANAHTPEEIADYLLELHTESMKLKSLEIKEELDSKDEEIAELEEMLELLESENRGLRDSIDRLSNENDSLRCDLSSLREESGKSEISQPGTYEELFSLVESNSFPNVIFSCGNEMILDYAQYDSNNDVVKKVWMALRGLQKYCEFKKDGNTEGLYNYIKSGNSVGLSKAMYAAGESVTTMSSKLGDTRKFKVPKKVDKSGYVKMYSHLKFVGSYAGNKQLRIHFYDYTGNKGDGNVYIGYFGKHLPLMSSK